MSTTKKRSLREAPRLVYQNSEHLPAGTSWTTVTFQGLPVEVREDGSVAIFVPDCKNPEADEAARDAHASLKAMGLDGFEAELAMCRISETLLMKALMEHQKR